MISRSPGCSWQLKAEGWPQKGRHFYISTKRGKLYVYCHFLMKELTRIVWKKWFLCFWRSHKACGICIIPTGLQIIFFSISNKFAQQKGVNHIFELIFCPGHKFLTANNSGEINSFSASFHWLVWSCPVGVTEWSVSKSTMLWYMAVDLIFIVVQSQDVGNCL